MPLQFTATELHVRLLRLLVSRPGLDIAQIAEAAWGGADSRCCRRAEIALDRMCRKQLAFPNFRSDFWKKGAARPVKRWYASEKGYVVHEFYKRQDSDAPHTDREG